MCGISAIFDPERRSEASARDLRRMHDLLRHRGPDAEGFLAITADGAAHRLDRPPHELPDGRPLVSVAFRRLRILDRSVQADQPLSSPDGRRFIVLNGEIYNYRKLRAELASDGYTFRTDGDSEVALAAYDRWGRGCFERFDGMWALLIVDLDRRRLVGSRDRLGIKPLYFSTVGGRLVIASEPKAVATTLPGGLSIEPARFIEFLYGFPPQSPSLSFFAGVLPVPAATCFELSLEPGANVSPVFDSYWDLRAAVATGDHIGSLEAATDALAGLVCSSVENQLQADVPVGTLLSGGLDSSYVTRLAADAGIRPRAFSLVYADPDMDESRYIAAVTDGGGIDGVQSTLSPDDAFAATDAVVRAQGEPLLGWELLAQHRVFALAREHDVIVTLDGSGADELLGGYPFYEAVVLRDRLRRGHVRTFATELLALARKYRRSPLSVLRSHVIGPIRRRSMYGRALDRPSWLEPELPVAVAIREPSREPIGDGSALNRLLYDQTLLTNLPSTLTRLDRNSMSHSIESRVPYLDHRIVELAFRLPSDYKIALGDRKIVLRRAARRRLPELVTERTDMKAFVSSPTWLDLRRHSAPLRDLASAIDRGLPWVRPREGRRFVDGFLAGEHDNRLGVWRLYTAWRWLESLGDRVDR